ncbi:MAG: TldD/PmbA family protein [Nitrosarchaeum sp.]|nr:TldD/PmbA family protein [Nitrosarchaeum sp.]
MNLGLQDIADKAVAYATDKGATYCDARAEEYYRNSAVIENGDIEHIKERTECGIGIRLLNSGAWAFCAFSNPDSFDSIRISIDNALVNSRYAVKTKEEVKLCAIPVNKAKINSPVLRKPDMESLLKIGLECSDSISKIPHIIKSIASPWFSETSKYFKSSEGSEILQTHTDTVIDMVATAHESGITQSINITEGGRGGIEQIIQKDVALNSARKIAHKASELTYAKPAKEEEAVVVMNPDFVALLTHEILGHPSEADRVLGKEMAWAGGAWWKGKLGTKIGSEALNVFDDPTISHSLGKYHYDDEGVKTKKTQLIENGVLSGHMQNRETAQIFGTEPTGNMRATDYTFMPLIRMACTCIGSGDWKHEEMIKDVKHGYLICNMKIPSIDMRRYNWSISCQYAQKIENGEITDLLRDVIVVGNAPDFFNSVDACGDNFMVRPITNCGKGDPMQSMIMGNGGPSVRGIATVKSV